MTVEKQKLVVIAAKPGIMRNSLLSYLRALLGVSTILLADDANLAEQMIREHQPELVVVDADLSENEMLRVIQFAHAQARANKTIALVTSLPQQQLCLAQGATHALLKGFLDKQLRDAVLNEGNAAPNNLLGEIK